ncbi:hypothetical protein AOA80_00645 [Methanomassiliicoccales archaeon RumEn M1]|nr:hypothetical protein AOA80_00645 [Methanomassiliicoccales archaeon RumEn M1]
MRGGAVVALEEVLDVPLRQGAHRGRRAGLRAPHGMVAPQRLGEQVVDVVVGIVLQHVDLLQDHVLLRGEAGGVQGRVEHHVGQYVLGHVHRLVEGAYLIAGDLLGGVAVHLSSRRLDLLRHLPGGAPRGPFEQHVFQHVGDA